MGGRLIQSILTNGMEKLDKSTRLIVSPQSELRDFRIFLKEKGFLVLEEHMMTEDGQFYVIMECVYMGADYAPQTIEEAKLRYGESLLREKNESLKAYLYKEKRIAEGIYTQLSARNGQEAAVQERLGQLRKDLDCIDFALEYYNFA
jgi:tRNA (adenine22-N1)-methyltransferase